MARIQFQLDEHVPQAVAQALRRRGIFVLTSVEAGLVGASDEEQMQHALSSGLVLVTQDRGFLRLHARQPGHAGIAYCDQGSRSIGQLVRGLVLIHEVLEADEMAGRVEFL